MISMGIRVKKTKVNFCIVEEKDDSIEILTISDVVGPEVLDVPTMLSFIRSTLITIILQYKVSVAAIRVVEPIAKSNVDLLRVNIEGVIQEALSNSSVEKYYIGRNSNTKKIFKSTSKNIIAIFDEHDEFKEIRENSRLNNEQKEAIVMAISGLMIGDEESGCC